MTLPARKPGRFSQCERLLRILEDGGWHSTSELLREVPCIVHSRIAELRKRGYVIEHETVGPGASGSRYRLLSERDHVGGAVESAGSLLLSARSESILVEPAGEPHGVPSPDADSASTVAGIPLPASPAEQLTLEQAA